MILEPWKIVAWKPSGHVERPDRRQRKAAILAPGEECGAGSRIGPACVVVADVGGEELDIAPVAWSPQAAISAGTTSRPDKPQPLPQACQFGSRPMSA